MMTDADIEAWAGYNGYRALAIASHGLVSDLDLLIEELRSEKNYAVSDRLRTMRDRLYKAASYCMPHPPGSG